jgi:hypothetical protein
MILARLFWWMKHVETTYSLWILLSTSQHKFQERFDAGSVKTRLFASSKQCELLYRALIVGNRKS